MPSLSLVKHKTEIMMAYSPHYLVLPFANLLTLITLSVILITAPSNFWSTIAIMLLFQPSPMWRWLSRTLTWWTSWAANWTLKRLSSKENWRFDTIWQSGNLCINFKLQNHVTVTMTLPPGNWIHSITLKGFFSSTSRSNERHYLNLRGWLLFCSFWNCSFRCKAIWD